MKIELELTPDMFYYDFDFYNGTLDLDFSYKYKEVYIINAWGIDITLSNEKIKKQLSEETIKKLKIDGKYDRIFIDGISSLHFYDVVEVHFDLEMLIGDTAKRVHDINNKEVILKYRRGEKKDEVNSKTFKFPDATVFFPNSWMEGYIVSQRNAKLIFDLEDAILMDEYLGKAQNIYSNFKKKYDYLKEE